MQIEVSEKIILKTLELQDVEERYKVIDKNRKFLRQWLGWLDLYKSSKDLIEYTKICQKEEKSKEGYTFGIYYLGKFIGCIEIQDIDYRNKKCEIGYWLDKDSNGKGIMTACCIEIIDYIYEKTKLNRISILTATENYSSQAIPKKLGFLEEGILLENECLYGRFVDNYIYSMTKNKWEKMKQFKED